MVTEDWIEQLGVLVVEMDLGGDACGYYDDRIRTIFIDRRLSPIQWTSTMAHELGHAYYRHVGTTPRGEREASEWAARQLIPHENFMEVAAIYDNAVAMANELGVLPRDVHNYMGWVRREWRMAG
ncbi:ImmA/IrrE family metallo-endopeptidase [Arthrobacter sp. RCC_34]|uniref:ImmA/IrrE family metallo-endopeptidase n=1 Tax=Arthrobacter sp. RCC_34 TaxID=3239230 RepID=UPI00352376DC